MFGVAIFLSSCSTKVPDNPTNLCKIFKEHTHWYEDAQEVYEERGVPIHIPMAFMYHESGYVDDAKPPMRWFLFIPYGRGSSAYGYAQASDEVWNDYLAESGGFFTSRTDFKDSLDFISWYILKTKAINKIPITNVYLQYINYHDGWKGYRQGLYKKANSISSYARKVEQTANRYKQQLSSCDL